MLHSGRHVGDLAAMTLGALMLWWGDVSGPWLDITIDMPARAALAYAVAAVLILAGAGLFIPRTAKVATLVLAGLFAATTVVRATAIFDRPSDFHSWSGPAEQFSIVAGYLGVFACLMRRESANAHRLAIAVRVSWGCCVLAFGTAHFVYLQRCVGFVPQWFPGHETSCITTGFAHLAAGIGVLTGIWALLAARLATLMYIGFGLLVWGNIVALRPMEHLSWSGFVLDFTLVAGAWMVADTVRAFPSAEDKLFRLQGRSAET